MPRWPSMAMKRPAAAAFEAEEEAGDVLMKKPAAALMKRPAAAGEAEDHEESAPAEADGENPEEGPSEAQLANMAVNAVRKQQRVIDRITAANETLAQRMKSNKSDLRKAEKEMESLKEVAKKHTRKLGAQKSAKLRKKMEGKAMRAKAKGERAAEAIKRTQKHLNKVRKGANVVKEKADFAEAAYKKAQKAYEECKKRCKQLKDEGEDVPDEGEKDLSAPGAYKPPGVRAAKERDTLKASLKKLKEAWEKAHAVASVKLERMGSFKEKIAALKQQSDEAAEEEASVKKKPAAK
mmetsp:Transcript_30165/g.55408  ORF Transcript_30165/g.55408 Transcript_30165/m.55408 type:complete len:294 (-) Transcript_30165:62-943(-)